MQIQWTGLDIQLYVTATLGRNYQAVFEAIQCGGACVTNGWLCPATETTEVKKQSSEST